MTHRLSLWIVISTYQLPRFSCFVIGNPKNELPVNFLNTKTGRRNFSPFPNISSPKFIPRLAHQISPCLKITLLSFPHKSLFSPHHSLINVMQSENIVSQI